MAEKDDDMLIHGIENISHSWDEEEWHRFFLDAYNKLGGKINRFIKYVEKEWK
jgi:hypothetical protein